MIDFTIDTQIARAPGDVFAYVADPAKLATWQTNTVVAEQLGDGPLGVGTRLREVHRAPGGRELESVVEVSEYEPGEAFGLRMVEGSLPLDAHISFAPAAGGTLMAFRVVGRPTGAAKLGQPLLRRVLARQFRAYCTTLKGILEESRAAG